MVTRARPAALVICSVCLAMALQTDSANAESGVVTPVVADFYMAPDGDDANPGTADEPFATLGRARDAVRERVRAGLETDITVLIRGGRYELNRAVVFDPEDSPSGSHHVTYAAYGDELPVFSGGRRITDWRKKQDNRFEVVLPTVRDGHWRFRQLWTGDLRLPRGRYPNQGMLTVKEVSDGFQRIVLEPPPPDGDLAGREAELVMIKTWAIARATVDRRQDGSLLTRTPLGVDATSGHDHPNNAVPGGPAYLEHAPQLVDQPGEWHLDHRTGTLVLQAAAGQDPQQQQFVAPKAECLLRITGRPGAPVRNLRFVRLRFEHAAWHLPQRGHVGIQAGYNRASPVQWPPVAVELKYAIGCRLERCAVAHVGASGIGLGAGCRANTIIGCQVFDAGANGIQIGWRSGSVPQIDQDWSEPHEVPADNRILDNHVHHCAVDLFGCVGIMEAFARGTHIAHNLVHDLPYTGISVGFTWGDQPTSQRGCLIERNHIHDVMQMLADGGAIYTLGAQPGTVLRGNLIHGVRRSPHVAWGAPNNGLFFDSRSSGFLVERNIVYDTTGEPIRLQVFPKEVYTWVDNSFGVEPGDSRFPTLDADLAGPRPPYEQ